MKRFLLHISLNNYVHEVLMSTLKIKNRLYAAILISAFSIVSLKALAIPLEGLESQERQDPYFNYKTCTSTPYLRANINTLKFETKALRTAMVYSPESFTQKVRVHARTAGELAQMNQILQIDDSNIDGIVNRYGNCESANNNVVYMLETIRSLKN